VELLDRRFDQGDAVRVLGRVERFGNRLQVQVRALETAEDADPEALTPTLKRDADELDGFFEFLAAEIAHPGLARLIDGFVRDTRIRTAFRSLPAAGADGHHGYAGGLLEHTVGVATLCRETAQLHPRLRSALLLAAAPLLALGAALSWGTGDFLGGLATRRVGVLTVLVLSQAIGLAGVALWVVVARDAFPGIPELLPAAAAGISGVVGLAALYRGFAV